MLLSLGMKSEFEIPHIPLPVFKGPFIYAKYEKLDGAALVSTHQCASLIQYYTKAPLAKFWRKGVEVRGNADKIVAGTAIATFNLEGRYSNQQHDNHAAFYVSQSATGIWVIDQWADDPIGKPTISKRFLKFTDANSDGTYPDPSNNGAAMSVILAAP